MKKQIKPKAKKVIITSIAIVALGATCFFTLGRNKYYFVDNITDETYTTQYEWFWQKAEDEYPAIFHALDDGSGLIATGVKKTKSGFGVFAKSEYELVFEEATFNIHYVLGEDEDGNYIEAKDTYTYNGNEDQPLRFDLETDETKAGKTIVGWKIDCAEEDCDIYENIPAGSYGDVHAYPVYDDEIVNEATNDTETSETTDESAESVNAEEDALEVETAETAEPETTEEN